MLDMLVLGSAAGGGFPQWNCRCTNCKRSRTGDPAAQPRTQTSIAVRSRGKPWFLLNASPDLRQQIAEHRVMQPHEGVRGSPIVGVILTNAEIDHIAGLLHLRERQPLALYGTEKVLRTIKANPIFDALDSETLKRRELILDSRISLAMVNGLSVGLNIVPFAVPGKVPLYLEGESSDLDLETETEDTIALAISEEGQKPTVFYVPGCATITSKLSERLYGAEIVFFDGTLWRDNEMIAAEIGSKTGRRMGHISMSGPDGAISGFTDLNVHRKIFIHINNTNPAILNDTPERSELTNAGWEVAYDGMTISLY